MFHLTHDPDALPDLPAVEEFRSHIGIGLPHARIAVLAFDKLDVEKGMEIRGPDGGARWLRQPWSVLAYQLAGDEGLRLLHPQGWRRSGTARRRRTCSPPCSPSRPATGWPP